MNIQKIILYFTVGIFFIMTSIGLFLLETFNAKTNSNKAPKGFFENIQKVIQSDLDTFNILLLGGDVKANNTDTIIVINYNPSNGIITMLSIPRDTRTKIKGNYNKINSAYNTGLQGKKTPSSEDKLKALQFCSDSISSLLNIPIKYYILIDTSAFRDIIDILDGVEINVPVKMDYDDPWQNLHIHFNPGLQHLNGQKAEEYMRFRKSNTGKTNEHYDGSDLKRIDAQQQLILELIKQKANAKYVTKINQVIEAIFAKIITNIKLQTIIEMSSSINKINGQNIKMYKLYGLTPTIDDVSYFVFNNTLIDNSTSKIEDANKILKEYFMSSKNLPIFKEDFENNTTHIITQTHNTPSAKSTSTPTTSNLTSETTPTQSKTSSTPKDSETITPIKTTPSITISPTPKETINNTTKHIPPTPTE